jgi:phosphogluconate dehydratase
MNPTLLRVTQRIIERSKETRSAYLARIEQAKTDTVHRSQLACGNLAHGFAACQPDDKDSLKSMLRNNIAIITSYNDMLSLRTSRMRVIRISSVKRCIRRMRSVRLRVACQPCATVTQGRTGWSLSAQPK